MKLFMGLDRSEDKKNDEPSGQELWVEQIDSAMSRSLESSDENIDALEKSTKLPLPLRIIEWICFGGVLLTVAAVMRILNEDDVPLARLWHDVPALFIVTAAMAVVAAALWLWGHRKAKRVLESDEAVNLISNVGRLAEQAYAALGVPADAPSFDVLTVAYIVKDGRLRIKPLNLLPDDIMINMAWRLFRQEDTLYLANCFEKYAIPAAGVTRIRRVNRRFPLAEWNKEESCDKGEYKPYRMYESNGMVICRWYYAMDFTAGGEDYTLLFPCYELPAVQRLLADRSGLFDAIEEVKKL